MILRPFNLGVQGVKLCGTEVTLFAILILLVVIGHWKGPS